MSRRGFWRAQLGCAVGAGLVGACAPAPPLADNAPPAAPRPPAYVVVLSALGIQQEINRVANTLPASTADIPGVDGGELYDVERLADIPYREWPGRTLTLNVHRPRTTDARLQRGVILYFGGGFVADGDFETMETIARFLARRGIVAFNVHFRLRTEPAVTLPDIITDAIAAARFVSAAAPQFGADPDRLATLGRSSGGQLALLVGMLPNLEAFGDAGDPAISVRIRAIVDLSASPNEAELYSWREFTLLPRATIAAVYGGTPAQVPELYAAAAPWTYVRPGLPAILIVHGVLDTTVPSGVSARFADALEAAGNTVQREFQPTTGHVLGWGLFNNDGLGDALQVIVPFLAAHL